MGQYTYLINKENRICQEAYKLSTSGEIDLRIENDNLVKFLEYCRINKLTIECVSEHWFDENVNLEVDKPYTDFYCI